MPQILKRRGLRFVIYPNDHQPSHVHIIGNGCEAVFNLRCPEGLPELRVNYDFSRKEPGKISYELTMHLRDLCQNWREIHGYY